VRPEDLSLIKSKVKQVAVSDTHLFGSTVEGLETVSHLITRYAIFEDVHLQRNTAASADLEPALTALYAELLIFLAKAKKYFQTPTTGECFRHQYMVKLKFLSPNA